MTAKAGKQSHENAIGDIVRESMVGSKNVAMARDLDSGTDSLSLDDAIGLESAGVANKIRVRANLENNNVMLAHKKSKMNSARSPTEFNTKNFKILAQKLTKAQKMARKAAAKA